MILLLLKNNYIIIIFIIILYINKLLDYIMTIPPGKKLVFSPLKS